MKYKSANVALALDAFSYSLNEKNNFIMNNKKLESIVMLNSLVDLLELYEIDPITFINKANEIKKEHKDDIIFIHEVNDLIEKVCLKYFDFSEVDSMHNDVSLHVLSWWYIKSIVDKDPGVIENINFDFEDPAPLKKEYTDKFKFL